jgi:cytochrome b subunit of formate dehydrogenase
VLASLRVLFFALAAASVVVLALTGFISYLLIGSVSGVSLVLHVAIAPVFAVCMTAATLLWAHRQRLDAQDLTWLSSIAQRGKGLTRSAGTERSPALKLSFWAMVVLAPLIMGSIMLSMYPLFGTPGQRSLLTLHLVSGLLFVVVAVVQVVILVGASNLARNEREDPHDPAE